VKLHKQEQKSGKEKFNIRVLVTDDDAVTRKIMPKLLERFGCRVDTAENGRVCIDKVLELQSRGESYDLLFSDNQMPVMNGRDAIEELRARGFKFPIVSLTGSSEDALRQSMLDAGATTVIVKPASLIDIENILKSLFSPSS